VEFTVSRGHLPALWKALDLSARMHGGMPAGYRALNALRLEAGIPWFGYDFDESTLPHEAGLENSHISYSKGCYLGQEIVERVRSRGRVNRHLALLEFRGDAIPPRGTELFGEESSAQKAGQPHLPDAAAAPTAKPAGHVTRSSWSPARRQPIAMAYLRREFLTPGGIIRWQHGEADIAGEIPPGISATQ
jgi:folate-binding protein YgfZ